MQDVVQIRLFCPLPLECEPLARRIQALGCCVGSRLVVETLSQAKAEMGVQTRLLHEFVFVFLFG